MTLRQGLGPDIQRLYEQIDVLLDSEDAIITLADGHRTITTRADSDCRGALMSCWLCKSRAPYVE